MIMTSWGRAMPLQHSRSTRASDIQRSVGVLAPGTLFGGCRIEGVVGRGGMGVVYRAHQLDLDRDVALKVIAPELIEHPQSRNRFLTEARAAGAVEHPNVVPIHGVGIADGQAYLVMRYVAGDNLRTVVHRQGALTATHAAEITARLGDALDAIHRAGYVHRDVKPQNVMIDESDHVYLSDFGLAKEALATTGLTKSDQWVGTLDYVAPEQIRGHRVDARTDVYALGGVLYFMLTGHVPFEREGQEAKMWAHLHDEPPRPTAAAAGVAGRLRRRRAARAREGPGASPTLGRRPRPGCERRRRRQEHRSGRDRTAATALAPRRTTSPRRRRRRPRRDSPRPPRRAGAGAGCRTWEPPSPSSPQPGSRCCWHPIAEPLPLSAEGPTATPAPASRARRTARASGRRSGMSASVPAMRPCWRETSG